MKINRVDLKQVKMPLKAPFETSFGRLTYKEMIIVTVYSEGYVGYGESVAMPFPIYNEETNGTVWSMLEEFLIPRVFETEIEHPSEVSDLFSFMKRNNMAKAALECAIWDLYSKQKSISLSEALGGKLTEIEVGVSIGIEDTVEALLLKVDQFLKEGYKKIKVKIKPGWDIEPLRAIRETFGYEIPLMADANSAYTLADIETLKKLDEFKLMMIEQPLAHDDIIDHAKLQQEISTPVCLDESIHSLDDARKAIELGSCKIINIKIGRVGGLSESIRIHDYCAQNNIPVWCGGMLEAGIGRAHNIAIASLSNFTIPGDTSASDRYWQEDIIYPEVTLSKPGIVTVPTETGIGFKVEEKIISKYVVKECEYFSENYKNIKSGTT
ncbi:o-succinylbenzoate synthase [Anaerobacillus alkaliphilus]|uniref:o-succinylbenzoate synthase n=1 Tax=Anaerobacillus alkaliphilus TaxID=1548597 RepID=A0A4Q0VLT9_9BACI|nr:o-succinylbenzoate synthase [Anaerobacillus alkaliphilus]RXI96173.1 o-succinylbenzoate synthase [Anaerobacillus alkaliphilus]